ncbi:MAG: S-layer homology domain-containing protein [Oscillospiraceae bacterium]|nr:S-layer homology domain-containing protein [Oscillospiraceae bacterium]
MDSEGNLFAFYGYRDSVLVVPEAEVGAVLELENEGYTFGAATIGDDNYLYVVWGMTIYDDEIDDSLDVENVQICKYDKNGSLIEVLGLPVQTTRAQFPFRSGNANIVYQAGYLCVLFDTRWMESSDGIQHQGCEFVGIDADTMTVVNSSTNQGSHSFGVSMIATDYGFAAVQMGDAGSGRGINLNRYVIEDGTIRTVSGNGRTVLFHSSGQYGTNANHLDGNDTYTYMAGVAMSNSTYAVAGKSERVYTTDIYYSSGPSTGIYDVFVRIADASLLLDVEFDLAGEDRIDVATGEVADQNVVWLTQCTETEQAGNVKIVTLDSGAYCVLWEKFVNGSFDSIRYVILDKCGNILRQETAIYGARLSNTSIQPIVQGNALSWAVADGFVGSITWYSVDLDALDSNHFTDVNTGHYFYNAVLWAVDSGITSGTTETTFSPFLTAERCQVVTFLWRAAGCPEPTSTENPFTDVNEGDYFYTAVLWAVEQGITTGTSDTTFSPYNKCERCQVVTFLYRYFGKPEVTTTSNPFTDVDTDDYFYNAVLWAVEEGVTSGTTATTFGPFVTCERCMVVTFLYRALVD